jgi:hypothetical protein
MKKCLGIIVLFSCLYTSLLAQWGSIAVFEKNPDQKVRSVRIFPVKCTVTSMHDSAYKNLKKSVNAFMHLDGTVVYTSFYIPFTGYEGAIKFAIDEYIGKKDAKKVRFIQEYDEILLDQGGNVVSANIQERPIGIMVIYYADYSKTTGGMAINSAYAYNLYGKPGFDVQQVATTLAARVLGSSKHTYEWLPGKTMEYAKNKVDKAISFRDNGEYRTN